MRLFSVDLTLAATAYIRADSPEAALAVAKGLNMTALEIEKARGSIQISGRKFDDPNLPDVSLSPAVTVYGPADTDTAEPVEV